MWIRLLVLSALFLLLFPVFQSTFFISAEEGIKLEPQVDDNLKAPKIPLSTDHETVQREAQAISSEGYSVEEQRIIRESAERHQFQAEVNRVMSIIINSLYSNKDIFIRELISNASDALDKIRFLSLTDKSQLGDNPKLEIRIRPDPETKTLTITDSGIGMTREDLISKLGTIAKSGTREFLENMKDSENNLIGQFGVGFYSAFLVSDIVTVTSKNNNDEQWIWESDSNNTFTVSRDPRGNTLGRGTRITLQLKEDALDYLKEDVLKGLIKKYSEFINFPIYLWSSEEVTDEAAEDTETDDEPEVEIKDEAPEDKKVEDKKKVVFDWTLQNQNKPIWTRTPTDVSEEEYNNFFKSFSKAVEDPLAHIHFFGEGEIEFKSILYIPSTPPTGMFEPDKQKEHRGLRLYVKRVFISDDFADMLPRYLNFIKGVVDSDNLPLNVSREILQQDRTLSLIKKKLVRKAIAMIQTLSENKEKYAQFWEKYGTSVKLGVAEDTPNRPRLAKLVRFYSSKTKELTGFQDYVERMKEGQTQIYYIAGESTSALENSPLVERLLKKGYEVLYLTDPIDEWSVQSLTKYENKYPLTNVAKEGVKIEGEDEKEDDKVLEEEFKPLLEFLKENLKGKISKAVLSHQLVKTPSAITSGSFGFTANMERLMKAQAFADTKQYSYMKSQRILEINPKHPLIKEFLRRVDDTDGDKKTIEDLALILYDTASLNSGFALDEPAQFAQRIHRMMKMSLNIDADLEAPEEEEIEAPEAVKETKTKVTESHNHDDDSDEHDHEHEEL
jgi:heat shock protein beta